MKHKLIWRGHFNKAIGYGEEARQFVLAASKAGIPVEPSLIRISIDGNESTQDTEGEIRLLESFLRSLPAQTPLGNDGTRVSISHSIPSLFYHDPHASVNVGRCMFETDRLPESWVNACVSMDELWVPSNFNLETFRRSGIPPEKLHKLPGAIDTDVYAPEGPVASIAEGKRFKFFSMFEWTLRKGWDILVESFVEEFSSSEPVLLILKTWTTMGIDYREQLKVKLSSIDKTDKAPILLLDDTYFPEVMPAVYRGVHAFVLPSHGEGWGRPYMEAMACGLPTIATDWSGNTEFMNHNNSFLLDYELGPVNPEVIKEVKTFQGHGWANPDKAQLRHYLRHVYENYEQAKEVGAQARKDMHENFSHPVIGKLLQKKLASF